MTAHQLLPFSHLFTQQLGLAGMWIDRHTLTETCLIIHQDCVEEVIEKHFCLGEGVLLFVPAEWVNTSR